MIAPEAGLSVIRQCALLGIARSTFYYRSRPEAAAELELLKRLDRIFTDNPVYGSRRAAGRAFAGWGFGRSPTRAAADAEARAVGSQAEAKHQQAASRAQGLSVPSARQNDRPAEPSVGSCTSPRAIGKGGKQATTVPLRLVADNNNYWFIP